MVTEIRQILKSVFLIGFRGEEKTLKISMYISKIILKEVGT